MMVPESQKKCPLVQRSAFLAKAQEGVCFGVNSDEISILSTPKSFYQHLCQVIPLANKRISIASLYLGTGAKEQHLLQLLELKCQQQSDCQIRLLMDYSRAQRGGENSSVSMISKLIAKYPNNVSLYLYKVPQLPSFSSKLPPHLNETVGVFHLKAYVFDETLIMSGANLSEDYFTNRQDRYMQLRKADDLSNFYHTLIERICEYSYKVNVQDGLISIDEVKGGASNKSLKDTFHEIISTKENSSDLMNTNHDTFAIPTLQFNPIGFDQDEKFLSKVLSFQPEKNVNHKGSIWIASGYLNFPRFIEKILLQNSNKVEVITASPLANGFYNGAGIKSAIPMAYSLIEQNFYDSSRKESKCNEHRVNNEFRINLFEYVRPDWTFHAKGLWFCLNSENLPEITIIGSSNFGRRSYGRDLESQVYLFTSNKTFQSKLRDEYSALKNATEKVSDKLWKRPDRNLNAIMSWKNGYWIRPVVKLISSFF